MTKKIIGAVLFQCEICSEIYQTEKEALDCEAKGTPTYRYRTGDKFITSDNVQGRDPAEIADKTQILKLLVDKNTHKPAYHIETTVRNRCPHCHKELRTGIGWLSDSKVTESELAKIIIEKLP